MEQRFIRVLPFYLRPVLEFPEMAVSMPVALWYSAANICEGAGSRCDDSEHLYYSIAGDHVVWQCPRHWYEGCLAPNAPFRLVEMTDEQFKTEREEHKKRLFRKWDTASRRLRSSAAILESEGLQEQAGRLWEAHGSIRSSLGRM